MSKYGRSYKYAKPPNCEKGARLIGDLQNDPERFIKNGQGAGLLEELYHGFPKEALAQLLRSEDLLIRREALAVIDELGTDAACLLDSILPLLNDEDDRVACYAAEIALNCGNIDEYIAVFNARAAVAAAISRMSERYLSWVREFFDKKGETAHVRGISALLGELPDNEIDPMRGSDNQIIKKYGEIAERR